MSPLLQESKWSVTFFANLYNKPALVSSCRCPKFHHELYAIEWTPTIGTSCNINHDGIWDTYKVQTPGRRGETLDAAF